MKFRLLFFWIPCVLQPLIATANTSLCATAATAQSHAHPEQFVGFGDGASWDEAQSAATANLARSITQTVNSSTEVNVNNSKASISAYTQSYVQASLVGVKVIQRCSPQASSSYAVVVALDKSLFLQGLQNRVKSNNAKAQGFFTQLASTPSATTLASARAFLKEQQTSFVSDVELCQIYQGCQTITTPTVMEQLNQRILELSKQRPYVFEGQGAAITIFKDDISSFLSQQGLPLIQTADVDENAERRIDVKCQALRGSLIPGAEQVVVTSLCSISVLDKGIRTQNWTLSCKAMADVFEDPLDAAATCRGRLQQD